MVDSPLNVDQGQGYITSWYIISPAAPARSTSGRPDETRLKEHRDACERGMMEKSAVAEHAWENHHLINWEETTVLDHGRGQELLVKEALYTSR